VREFYQDEVTLVLQSDTEEQQQRNVEAILQRIQQWSHGAGSSGAAGGAAAADAPAAAGAGAAKAAGGGGYSSSTGGRAGRFQPY